MSDRQPARSRRELLRDAAALGSAVGLAGCGNSSGGSRTPTTSSSTATAEPTATGSPTPTDERTVYAGFLDSDEVAAIQRQLSAGNDPWESGFQVQLRDARRALDATPSSVVDNGAPDGVDDHRYATSENRTDYRAAIRMGRWIRDLGVAYVFTGRDRFAREAVELIDHWFLAPETRMHPSGENFGETYFSIELHITIPTMLYGAALVRDSAHWSSVQGSRDDLRAWVETYLADLEDGRGKDKYTGVVRNNIYAWWLVARATAAAYLDDRAALERTFDDWRSNALDQILPSGLLKLERQREDGLDYSIYGITALTLTAEIARHYGVDLYGYTVDDDDETSVLRRAYEAHQEYVVDPSDWKWGIGENGYTDSERSATGAVYELAYSRWQDSEFESVVESIGRPLYERRILGWTTLTHANRFALDLD